MLMAITSWISSRFHYLSHAHPGVVKCSKSFTKQGFKVMDEETFNKSVRAFLKKVGITSQRELEKLVDEANQNGNLDGKDSFGVKIRLETDLSSEPLEINDTIKLS
jgi:hypothetical protein